MTIKTGKLSGEQEAEIAAFRAALCLEVGCCEICRVVEWPAVCCNEVIRAGGVRKWTKANRATVLVLCHDCHMRRVHSESMPVITQLAYLHRSRPLDLRLDQINRWSIKRIYKRDIIAKARELDLAENRIDYRY